MFVFSAFFNIQSHIKIIYNSNTIHLKTVPKNNKSFIDLEKVIRLLRQQYNKAGLKGNKQRVANN